MARTRLYTTRPIMRSIAIRANHLRDIKEGISYSSVFQLAFYIRITNQTKQYTCTHLPIYAGKKIDTVRSVTFSVIVVFANHRCKWVGKRNLVNNRSKSWVCQTKASRWVMRSISRHPLLFALLPSEYFEKIKGRLAEY